MYLIQILLPVQDAQREAYCRSLYSDLARDLTTRFGGLTAYLQSPATGYWEEGTGRSGDMWDLGPATTAGSGRRPTWVAS